MNNLEKIKQAWKWNYGAVFRIVGTEAQKFQVVNFWQNAFGGGCVATDDGHEFTVLDGLDYEILGYKYLGELGGNEEIPKNAKFKFKTSGFSMEFKDFPEDVSFKDIEPVFD